MSALCEKDDIIKYLSLFWLTKMIKKMIIYELTSFIFQKVKLFNKKNKT